MPDFNNALISLYMTECQRRVSPLLADWTAHAVAFGRTPLGAAYYTLCLLTLLFRTWESLDGISLGLQVAQSLTLVGWLVFGTFLLWGIGRAIFGGRPQNGSG